MQSMYQFIELKKGEYGIRTSLEPFSCYDKVKVVPLYAISNKIMQEKIDPPASAYQQDGNVVDEIRGAPSGLERGEGRLVWSLVLRHETSVDGWNEIKEDRSKIPDYFAGIYFFPLPLPL